MHPLRRLTVQTTDDLPEIRKNIEQGFKETQQTVTKWISNFTKKLDGEMEEYDRYGNPQYTGRTAPPQQRQNFGPSQSDQMHGIRKSAEQRRSADHNRYDADNRVIGDDFAKLELRDNDCKPLCLYIIGITNTQQCPSDPRAALMLIPTSSNQRLSRLPRAVLLMRSTLSTATHRLATQGAKESQAARSGSL